ncbi:MAG: glycerophosphodiester phosphodiesterase [Thermodesulfobacteriota bacterium]
MAIPDWIENCFVKAADAVFARVPAPRPDRGALKACRLISHRGEYDNRTVLENTLGAFDAVACADVWGLECDLRWTRDLVPVISHDPDLLRLHGKPEVIARMTWAELRAACPLVPSLREVVERYGGKTHLMLEIKQEPYPDPIRQNRALGEIFAGLSPGRDYHLITLSPDMFRKIDFIPRRHFMPIAQINIRGLSRLALEEGYGGVNGHYLFMSDGRIRMHHARGQQVGTGFISSRNCLYREIARGVDFIYSNHAARLQAAIHRELL